MKVIRLTIYPREEENGFTVDSKSFAGEFHYAYGAPAGKTVLAIGEFDGMHRGHREVIERAKQTALAHGAALAIMTFDPHPRKVLGQDKYEKLLTPTVRKLELLAEQGVQHAYVAAFNETMMRMSPYDFVETVLLPLNLETVVIGFDFRFGHKASGNAGVLRELASGRFGVEVVQAYEMQGTKISSSAIREALANGQVSQAGELLSRSYDIRGSVIHGDARGRTIGFPTANLELDEPYVIPGGGVYAVCVNLGDERLGGVMNIGFKPTFQTGELRQTLEVHLFDFNRDIYGESLQVEFIEYLRPERKFPSVSELIAQIHEDGAAAQKIVQHLLR